MNTRKFMREVSKVLEAEQMQVLGITTGKHLKYRVQTPGGPRMLVCSVSPSDRNAVRQVRRLVARMKMGRA